MTATALITPDAAPRQRLRLPAPMKPIIYPDSDGKPMADNTRQFEYIVMIEGGLAALFADPFPPPSQGGGNLAIAFPDNRRISGFPACPR